VPDGTGLAQPVGDFLILSAVRNGQPLVLGDLTALPVKSSLTFFLFHRARRIFFLMFQKENGGVHSPRQSRAFLCRKAAPRCIPAAVRHALL